MKRGWRPLLALSGRVERPDVRFWGQRHPVMSANDQSGHPKKSWTLVHSNSGRR